MKSKLIEVSLPLEAINDASVEQCAAEARADVDSPERPSTNAPPRVSTAEPDTRDTSVVQRARYEGRYEVDATAPDAVTAKLREVIDEVVRHIVAAPGAENISIVLEVSAENSAGFSESVARTVRENSRVLGFDKSDFEDVEW